MIWVAVLTGFLVVKFLRDDASIVIVQELKDGQDKWRNLSGEGVVKGGDTFVVDGLDDFLDEGLFEQ